MKEMEDKYMKTFTFTYRLPEQADWKQRLFQYTGKNYDEFIVEKVELYCDSKTGLWTCTVTYLDR
jgi:hypothetical protein